MTALVLTTADPHPDNPNRERIDITGATHDAVQQAITAIMNHVDDVRGVAEFQIPRRHYCIHDSSKRWRSTGYVSVNA